ncbi:serine-rich adhesin for platelets isoform X4 [Lucilia cuprina]|uniref:serine-rich adhesin for platelets isoform X4 n=1 Tax=Lucilia cuprina TaxID=7375 RepID=UPI001F05F7DE|nr:serine-rich adhesin for platelets isoform X4 [Lucilia cuprina]
MEIMANTNNHNQKELRLYVPNEQQTTNSTQLTSGGARSPFQREVREWQRIDPDTGALLTGRLEADRWINGPLNKYGKKSSSSLSNSSNNSTTASQATTNPTSMNTHKSMATTANKISLHAIVGSGNSNNNMTTTSSTPSPTTTTRPSWQQPTLYRQNSHNNNNNNSSNNLMKSRVGDNSTNNCCSSSNHSSSSDESRSYIGKTETDLRHLQQQQRQSLSSSSSSPNHYQQQQQQQIHFKQNDRLTPTHLPHSYHRVDLESFRHYNNNDNNNNDAVAAADDDGLRLSSRHLRRQQTPNEPITTTTLQRSRSISTDDLSTEWDIQGVDSEEPAEWRRVSKLRRSFQSSTKTNQSYSSPLTTRRPLDLPTNSVSVSKIRAELENGRRLNTVMRNNHVDLAALSSILNGNADKECKSPSTAKRSSFLTAESLKEIRGKLKKLSDESLYKEDFLIKQPNNDANPVVEHIVNDQTKLKRNYEKSPERYRVTNQSEEVNSKHTTNSLESRLKYRDTNSTDWHIRRKSYGFEKMSPPEKAMLRMDASTDSGLGRSGELQNWSPTSEAAAANRTVVHFGESTKVAAVPAVQRRYRPQKSQEESENSPEEDSAVSKRHSIAVDESQYVKDNSRQTTQIHLNGFYEPGNYSKLIHSSESTTTNDRGQQKRVEFSKTEVHFATESGRVNIVETDSKPPPTNNFRRRRSRSSSVGPLQSLVKSATTVNTTTTTSNSSVVASSVAMPVTLFGDDNSKKKTIASTTVAYRAPLVGSPEPKDINGINVTVTLPSNNDTFNYNESSRSSYASTSGVDTTDCDTDEMTSLRGILKNKPAKPKPYVLGENIDKPDDLWGVQLKPVNNITKTERVYKSESPPLMNSLSQKSVAERIQELGSAASTQSNGFSTKINVSLGNNAAANNNWEETGLITATKRQTNVQELLMHDLKEHQKILDEGLKSTTLIIKTMRSANEFDEAMRRLSMASIEAAVVKPTPMLRSNSYQESTQSFDYMQPDYVDGKNLYKSTSYSSTTSWSSLASSRKYSQDSRKTSTDSGASFPRKDSMPRLSFLGNEQMPVSQQLQRLRLIYDAATVSPDEDSADEEVKSYFREQVDSDSGGGTQDSSSYEDDLCLENTNSWSRLKARKTIWKIDTDNGGERSLRKTLDKTDLPKSNVMSIKLHSPQASNELQPPLKVVPPIAKPRIITKIQESQPPKLHNATTVKQTPYQTSLPTKDSLKIIKEARGARQLREHELSYFGVPLSTSEDEKPKSKYTTNTNFRNSPKRSLPLRKLSDEESSFAKGSHEEGEQWQLESDKPDLLKHNAIEVKPAERKSLKKKAELDEEDEHLYENIANELTPVFKVKAGSPTEQYDRKMDLKRDAMILSEMNKTADQTLKDISDEAALKDRRRRSLQRRNSKPLETIDEKSIAERINDTCIAVKISRGTYSSEAKKTSRHSTPSPSNIKSSSRERTSSQSSVECCPRARSRSLSSEKEYDNAKAKPSRSTQIVKHKAQKPSQSRSSSLDSQRSAHSQYSSGEEQQQPVRSAGSFRREDRSRTKTKRITSSTSSITRDKHRDEKTNTKATSHQQHHHHHGDSKRLSSTTHSSSTRERVECKPDNANGSSSHKHHNSSSGLQRSTAISSSGRRQREDLRDSQRIKRSTATTASGRSTSERHDKHDQTSSKHATRSVRGDDERNSAHRSSSHRLERGDKENGKSSSSRSTKGHSSRSTSKHHHERSTNPEKSIHSSTKDSSKTKSTAQTENTTYVSVTNLTHIQNEQRDSLVKNEVNCESASENQIYSDIAEITNDNKIPPAKPPRKKRKQSLIPIAIPARPDREPPLPPLPPSALNTQTPNSDSPTYEYKIVTKNIPPSYSNQSTLRKSSLPRPTSRLAMLVKARKPSLKHTQSTSSSFAFLPYLPAKRNSDVSHVYDNYMLYAVPAAINTKAYKQNLVNDHAQLFGSTVHHRYHPQYGVAAGMGGKGMKRRTVRSSVSTHQPFGICTCS